jgi:hypothetical protein
MKLTDNQRADLIDKAILNGACEGDRALLNSLSDRSLIAMNDTFGAGGRFDMKPGQKGGYLQAGGKGTPDEYKLSGNKDVDDEDDEDDFGRKGKRSDNSRSANGTNSNASRSSGGVNNDGSVEQWLTANNAPPAIRSAVTNAVQLERRQKIDIIGRLVSNVSDSGQRRRLVDNLIKKDLGELSDMLSMMPTHIHNEGGLNLNSNQHPLGSQDLQPLYMGANSPYGGFDSLTANVDNTSRDDLPIPPTMNFAEWAKEDRERNAG